MGNDVAEKVRTTEALAKDQGPIGPALVVRAGRGRVGGSTGLDLFIQRARFQGRRVKPLDGDLRSRTLSGLYPAVDEAGRAIADGATAPKSDELPDIKAWLSAELDTMAQDRVTRVLDLSGGDRVMHEYVRDVTLRQFCRDFGIGLTIAVFLGPEMEDFRHATQLLSSGGFSGERILLVLNEGVIRAGQTTAGVFDPIQRDPAFGKLVDAGARPLFIRRLTCLNVLRERGLRFRDVLGAKPMTLGPGSGLTPTLYHMAKTWLARFEEELQLSQAAEWLP